MYPFIRGRFVALCGVIQSDSVARFCGTLKIEALKFPLPLRAPLIVKLFWTSEFSGLFSKARQASDLGLAGFLVFGCLDGAVRPSVDPVWHQSWSKQAFGQR